MGFAGLTASETARRCGPVWRSSWRSKVSSRTEVRVLNLSRHLNSPGGPSLSFVAKARQISRVPKYASKSFRTPRIRQGPSRCLRGESDKAPSLPARPQPFAPSELARRALAVFGGESAFRGCSYTRCPGRSACQELSFLLPGVILCCIATLDGAPSRSTS